MGIEPPFLYDRPASYRWDTQLDRGFNPRAASQAAWVDEQREKARSERMEKLKQEGPLINPREINRHPDSYMYIPDGYLDFKPMSRRTKQTIIWMRRIQLCLRVLGLLGSTGLLVAFILIVPAGVGADWIVRVPVGIMILVSLYGAFHLSRGPGGRTPASSASYFIFSAIIDLALIPFMLFTAWTVRPEWVLAMNNPSEEGIWKTLVDYLGPEAKAQIFHVTWIGAVVLGGVSLACFSICVYLAIQFRKIGALPPDMNPFEENLTRRTSTRHKKDKSSVSTATTVMAESARNSTASLLKEKSVGVPWLHTRNNSSSTLQSSSAPNSPTKSRPDSGISMSPSPFTGRHSQTPSMNGSTASLSNPKRRQGHTRNDSTGSILPPRQAAPQSPLRQSIPVPAPRTAPSSPQRRSPVPSTKTPTRNANASPAAASPVYSDAESWYTDALTDNRSLHSAASKQLGAVTSLAQPDSSPRMSNWPLRKDVSETNWFAIGSVSDEEDDEDEMLNAAAERDVPELVHLRSAPSHTVSGSPPRGKYDFSNRSPKPLEMHPPTPPTERKLAVAQSAKVSYPQEAVVQGLVAKQVQKISSSQQQGGERASPYVNREARRNRIALQPASPGTPNRRRDAAKQPAWVEDSEFVDADEDSVLVLQTQQNLTPGRRNGERVVSSGYEDERSMLSVQSSNVKNRQVSGKVAEEGRAGDVSWRANSGMTALTSRRGW